MTVLHDELAVMCAYSRQTQNNVTVATSPNENTRLRESENFAARLRSQLPLPHVCQADIARQLGRYCSIVSRELLATRSRARTWSLKRTTSARLARADRIH
jgi:hypothetical protein